MQTLRLYRLPKLETTDRVKSKGKIPGSRRNFSFPGLQAFLIVFNTVFLSVIVSLGLSKTIEASETQRRVCPEQIEGTADIMGPLPVEFADCIDPSGVSGRFLARQEASSQATPIQLEIHLNVPTASRLVSGMNTKKLERL